MTEHMGFIMKLASRYVGRGVEREDLVQEGALGLLAAIERYDLTSEAPLVAYARPWVESRLQAATRKAAPVVVPQHVRSAVRRMARGEQDVDERVRLLGAVAAVPLDAPIGKSGIHWHEVIADDSCDTPSEDVDALLSVLSDQQRTILKAYYESEDESYVAIGRAHGLSGARVRQIVQESLRILRRFVSEGTS